MDYDVAIRLEIAANPRHVQILVEEIRFLVLIAQVSSGLPIKAGIDKCVENFPVPLSKCDIVFIPLETVPKRHRNGLGRSVGQTSPENRTIKRLPLEPSGQEIVVRPLSECIGRNPVGHLVIDVIPNIVGHQRIVSEVIVKIILSESHAMGCPLGDLMSKSERPKEPIRITPSPVG